MSPFNIDRRDTLREGSKQRECAAGLAQRKPPENCLSAASIANAELFSRGSEVAEPRRASPFVATWGSSLAFIDARSMNYLRCPSRRRKKRSLN